MQDFNMDLNVQTIWDSVLKLLNIAPLHLCILEDETSHKMKCLKDPNITKIIPLIDSRQTVWFDEVCHYFNQLIVTNNVLYILGKI